VNSISRRVTYKHTGSTRSSGLSSPTSPCSVNFARVWYHLVETTPPADLAGVHGNPSCQPETTGWVDIPWLLVRSAADQPRCFGARRALYSITPAKSTLCLRLPLRQEPRGNGALGRWASSTRHSLMMAIS
jgi:hypothetical protein